MLLRQIRAYRGNGISADLFYEGAVAEAIALIIARAAEIEILGCESNVAHISAEDRRVIEMLPPTSSSTCRKSCQPPRLPTSRAWG